MGTTMASGRRRTTTVYYIPALRLGRDVGLFRVCHFLQTGGVMKLCKPKTRRVLASSRATTHGGVKSMEGLAAKTSTPVADPKRLATIIA